MMIVMIKTCLSLNLSKWLLSEFTKKGKKCRIYKEFIFNFAFKFLTKNCVNKNGISSKQDFILFTGAYVM